MKPPLIFKKKARLFRWGGGGILALSLALSLFPVWEHLDAASPALSSTHLQKSSGIKRDPFRKPALFDDIGRNHSFLWRSSSVERGRYVARFQTGIKTVYTLDPALQKTMEQVFKENRVPYGAFVAMDPKSGKILAFVEHSARAPYAERLGSRATYPAASIFKIVTASALIEEKGVGPETPIIDRFRSNITTLGEAFAFSNNSAFQTMALRYLNIKTLTDYAHRFQFDRRIASDMPLDISRIRMKPQQSSAKGLKDLSAGFGDVGLSPLHGAMIGAAIANQGRMVKPCFVDYILDASGKRISECTPHVMTRAISARTAAYLRQMMGNTVIYGTARRAFRSVSGHPALRSVSIGGKTGSLQGKNPPGHVTWFVGMAPLVDPTVVVSTVVVNSLSGRWRIKASGVAREGFLSYFKSKQDVHRTRVAAR